MEAFQQFLTDWLRRREWSINRFADETGVSQSLISRWLHTDPRRQITPRPQSLRKLEAVLGVSYEDLLRMCGYLPQQTERPVADPVQAELDARLARLGATLSRYPRAFWLAVVEASERIAEAGGTLQGGVSDPAQDGVSATARTQTPRHRDPKRPFTANSPFAGRLVFPAPLPEFAGALP